MNKLLSIILLFISLFSYSQATFNKECVDGNCEYVFESYFGDNESKNRNYWEYEDNESQDIRWLKLQDEKNDIRYFIENKTEKNIVWSVSPVKIYNSDGDFQLKVHTEYWDGNDNYGYGVKLGYKDSENYIALMVAANDNYKIRHRIKGVDLGTEWKEFDGDIDDNYLNIAKIGKKIYFSISNNVVHVIDNDIQLQGGEIHLFVEGKTTVAFDDFKIVKQFNNEIDNNEELKENKRVLEEGVNQVSLNEENSQSYIGFVNKQVNFRKGPGTEYSVIKSLVPGTQLFVISKDAKNNYYNVIDVSSNIEGYVYKSFVDIGDVVEVDDEGLITSTGSTNIYNPVVEIYNNTKHVLTLKMGDYNFTFSPQEKRKINLDPGQYSSRASAPGVSPYLSIETLKSYNEYSWRFYIINK